MITEPGTWATPPPRRPPRPPVTAAGAEKALLGVALLDPSTVPAIAHQVSGDDFGDPVHRAVWAAVLALHDTGRLGTDVGLETRLQLAHHHATSKDRHLYLGLGWRELTRFTSIVNAATTVPGLVSMIRREAVRRRWREVGEQAAAVGEVDDPAARAEAAERVLERVAALAVRAERPDLV